MNALLKVIILIACFYLTCAHQVRPSGGPPDTVPPKIVNTTPLSGTLSHPVKGKITFVFSEWIKPDKIKKSVTIFPQPPGGFKTTVNRRKLEIKPKTAFAESTTYQIGFSTQLTDYHDVGLGAPYSFFFSTGSSIDSGEITGCIIDAAKIDPQTRVALFRCFHDSLPDSSLLNLPDYLVQTDSLGTFHFEHVRRGTYRVIAFIDKDNNNRLSPGTEGAFTIRENKISLDLSVGPLILFPILSDTTANRVKSVKAISPLVLLGEWADEYIEYPVDKENPWLVKSLDTVVKAPEVIKYISVTGSKKFAVILSDSLTTGPYSLIYKVTPRIIVPAKRMSGRDSTRKGAEKLEDVIRFNGTTITDTTVPSYKNFEPKTNALLDAEVKIVWSKPVAVKLDKWYVADTLGDTIKLLPDTSFSETSVFKPVRKFKPGRKYSTIIPLNSFVDLVGNTPKVNIRLSKTDSTKTDTVRSIEIEFSTIALKRLCLSLSGGAPCLPAEDLRIWQFKPLNSSSVYTARDSGSSFRFEMLPATMGTFAFFIDSSVTDGKYTKGNLFPWIPPEPYYSLPDTFEARAHWDIEEIEIQACDFCNLEDKTLEVELDSLKKD